MATVFPLFIADAEGASADRPPAGTENPRRSGDKKDKRSYLGGLHLEQGEYFPLASSREMGMLLFFKY